LYADPEGYMVHSIIGLEGTKA